MAGVGLTTEMSRAEIASAGESEGEATISSAWQFATIESAEETTFQNISDVKHETDNARFSHTDGYELSSFLIIANTAHFTKRT